MKLAGFQVVLIGLVMPLLATLSITQHQMENLGGGRDRFRQFS